MSTDFDIGPSNMARIDKLEALVVHLTESNNDLRTMIANNGSLKRPLLQSTIESGGDKLIIKKPKPVLKCPNKVAIKLKTVSSRDFSDDIESLPSSSKACSMPIDQASGSMADSDVSQDYEDDDDGVSYLDNFEENEIGSLEHAFLDSDELYTSSAPSTSDASEAQNSAIPIVDVAHNEQLESHPEGNNSDIPIIGEHNSSKWNPPPNAFAWFRKVADLGISDEKFQSLDGMYSPPDSDAHYFEPAKLPPVVWDSVRQNKGSALKLKACHKAQSYVTSAIKPLLSVLESLDPLDSENRTRLAYAIQLLTTSNLQFNRFKRAMAGPLIKREFRKIMLSQPVTHNNLFGEDFSKTSELAVKDVASTSKILFTAPPFRKPFPNQGRPHSGQSRPPHNYQSSANQASGSGRYNSNYESLRGRGSRGRGNSSFRGRSSGFDYKKKQ